MPRGNPNPKTDHLPKYKPKWNHSPTKAIRVPQIFLGEIQAYARALDAGKQPQGELTAEGVCEWISDENRSVEDLEKVRMQCELALETIKQRTQDNQLEEAAAKAEEKAPQKPKRKTSKARKRTS